MFLLLLECPEGRHFGLLPTDILLQPERVFMGDEVLSEYPWNKYMDGLILTGS